MEEAQEKIPMKYLSPVKGHMVARFGKDQGRAFIGVSLRIKRNSEGVVLSRKVVFHEDRVIAIPESEFNRYGKEYTRAIKSGGLKVRTEEEYNAYQERAAKEAKEVADKRKADKKKKAEQAAKKKDNADKSDSGLDGDGEAGPGKEGDGDPPKRRGRRKQQPGGTE